MKILFDTRQYVLDAEVRGLADQEEVFILERQGINDAGGIKNAVSVPVLHRGSSLERWLAYGGLQLTLPTYIRHYERIVSKIDPEVIVVADFFRLSSLQALRYRRIHPSVRLVFLCETQNYPKRYLSRFIMKLMLIVFRRQLRAGDRALAYTTRGQEFFAQAVPKLPVTVLPPAIDVDLFRPARTQPFLANGKLHLIMNARYVPYKRHSLLLAVLESLTRAGFNFELTLIGRSDDNRTKVESEVKERGLASRVIFLDPVPKASLPALLNLHDLLVLPSAGEALGQVIPEAMAAGLPTVTSDTVGANVYVVEGETGFIFKTDDANALQAALRRCFNADLLASLGQAARLRIEEKHSLLQYRDRLRLILQP